MELTALVNDALHRRPHAVAVQELADAPAGAAVGAVHAGERRAAFHRELTFHQLDLAAMQLADRLDAAAVPRNVSTSATADDGCIASHA